MWEGECRGGKFLGRLVFSVPPSPYDRRHNNMTLVILIYLSPQKHDSTDNLDFFLANPMFCKEYNLLA